MAVLSLLDPLCQWVVGAQCLQVDEGPATLVVGLIGIPSLVLTWIASGRISRAAYRDQNSYKFLIDAPENTEIFRFLVSLEAYMASDGLSKAVKGDPIVADRARAIAAYFEQTAVSVRLGLVSETFLRLSERSIVVSFVRLYRSIIIEEREQIKNPLLYREVEMLALRFSLFPPGPAQRFVETMLGRPSFTLTRWRKGHVNAWGQLLECEKLCILEGRSRTHQEMLAAQIEGFQAILVWLAVLPTLAFILLVPAAP
ncbi:DUF4760 domain-containing protein [Starkeya koreensis]|uniref:DUF4760 domain-containing protein n=1 Tax=Ancylobacter koreensis TaxID=266121 RepID=A0ABT0DRH6_9HYPH|nr:DUF4760 domain-containing protein [Ancylobacter koreensis]MCK0209879.1 DUF4760 domain-containing protein [Ancylobacter koreensis]